MKHCKSERCDLPRRLLLLSGTGKDMFQDHGQDTDRPCAEGELRNNLLIKLEHEPMFLKTFMQKQETWHTLVSKAATGNVSENDVKEAMYT